jgi:hypothetical protein
MKRILLSASIALLPTLAFADSQLDRLEDVSESMNDIMFDMMIREAVNEGADPEPLRAAVPDTSWDKPMRDAGQCMLDKLIEASSEAAVDQMLGEMEAALPKLENMSLETMGDELDFLPEGISDDRSLEINSECGLADVMMDRMEQSGFTEAMMQSMVGN